MLRGRNFRIASLTAAKTLTPDRALVTVVVDAEHTPPHRVAVCLEKMDEVREVCDVSGEVQRELALVKLRQSDHARWIADVLVRAGVARLAERTDDALMLEVSGEPSAVDRIVGAFQRDALIDIVRVGPIAMSRGTERWDIKGHLSAVPQRTMSTGRGDTATRL
jgi:acetolactate synthase-1/3 small subunit